MQHAVVVPRTLGINNWTFTAATARVISMVLLVTALVGGAVVVVFLRRTVPADEGAAIRRRYADRLVVSNRCNYRTEGPSSTSQRFRCSPSLPNATAY